MRIVAPWEVLLLSAPNNGTRFVQDRIIGPVIKVHQVHPDPTPTPQLRQMALEMPVIVSVRHPAACMLSHQRRSDDPWKCLDHWLGVLAVVNDSAVEHYFMPIDSPARKERLRKLRAALGLGHWFRSVDWTDRVGATRKNADMTSLDGIFLKAAKALIERHGPLYEMLGYDLSWRFEPYAQPGNPAAFKEVSQLVAGP